MADYEVRDESENRPISGSQQLIDDGDIHVRHGFIRKVFSIVTVQLVVTFGIAYPFVVGEWGRTFIRQNPILLGVVSFIPLVVVCYMMCYPQAARTYPQNYMCLAAITLAMGLIVGVSGAASGQEAFGIAAAITAVITFGLILFAFQTTYDFTGAGPYLFVMLLVLMAMGFVNIFFQSPLMDLVYAGMGALIMSMYIVFDVQKIIGGKHHQFRFSVDDYAFAALALYLDIINLFLFILRIVARKD